MIEEIIDLPEGVKQFKSFQDLEAELGDESAEEEIPGEGPGAFLLSTEDIAELAFNASLDFQTLALVHEDVEFDLRTFSDLTDQEKADWVDITRLAIQMQKEPDDDVFARSIQSRRAMRYLTTGWQFDEKHSPDEMKTYMVAPYDALPFDKRVPLLWFKASVKTLFKLWDQDNEYLKRK